MYSTNNHIQQLATINDKILRLAKFVNMVAKKHTLISYVLVNLIGRLRHFHKLNRGMALVAIYNVM